MLRLSIRAATVALCSFSSLTLAATAPADFDFDVHEIPLTDEFESDVYLVSRANAKSGQDHPLDVVVLESKKKDRFLSRFTFSDGWHQVYRMPLERDVQALDVAKIAGINELVAYRNQGLYVQAGDGWDMVTAAPSMYRGELGNPERDMDFLTDMDGDGQDDIMLPDFDGWRVQLQREGAFLAPTFFGPPAQFGAGSARYVYYRAEEPYLMDYNLDDRTDVAFWIDGAFRVYLQRAEGNFASDPLTMGEPDESINGSYVNISFGTGGDNEFGEHRIVEAVEDVNGDNMADLVLTVVQGESIIGIENRLDVHLGFRNETGMLEFPQTASTSVKAGGIGETLRVDADGDGQVEIMSLSFKLGLTAIVRALLTQSASFRLGVYPFEEGGFADDPVVTRKLVARFDLGSGDVFMPTPQLADLDGDGLKELLIPDDEDTVQVWRGERGLSLFARRAVKLPLAVSPTEGSVQIADVNGDGADDLVMHFEDRDAPRIAVATSRR